MIREEVWCSVVLFFIFLFLFPFGDERRDRNLRIQYVLVGKVNMMATYPGPQFSVQIRTIYGFFM